MGLIPAFTLIGQLTGSGVILAVESKNSAEGYLTAIGSQWAFSLLPFILSIIIPESPAYLLRKNPEGGRRKIHQASLR